MAAVVVFCALGAAPEVAQAEPDQVGLLALVVSGPVGAASVPFGIADVAYGADDSWLPPAWAITQLVLGAAPNLGFSIFWFDPGGSQPTTRIVLGVTHLVVGTWFLTHGILSLVLYEDPDASGSAPEAPSAQLGIAPIESGVTGTLVGTF